MAIIDEITTLRTQGKSDGEIITTLQEKGLSPREINDALTQSKIKNAVQGVPTSVEPIGGNQGMNDIENRMEPGMQPSVMNQGIPPEGGVQALPQEGPYAQEIQNQQPPQPDYSQQPPQPTEEYYDPYQQESTGGEYYETESQYQQQPGYGADTETVSEIASQIISEKMRKTNKIINELTEVKTLLTSKVEKIDDRLSRIEKIIDQLQTSLLRKAGEQEQNISDIKTEMEQMQEGFGKVLNPLIDHEREKPRRRTTKKRKKKK